MEISVGGVFSNDSLVRHPQVSAANSQTLSLKNSSHRESTKKMYYQVWKQFNKFRIRLDKRPKNWEQCIVLFVGYLINEKKQSSTIKSYLSGIRAILKIDGVKLKEDQFLITSLTKACKLKNDKIRTRKPIGKRLLTVIVNQVKKHYEGEGNNQQPYLSLLYRTIFTVAYYGLFRVGEVTSGSHPILARDVFISDERQKIKFILRTSKTHTEGNEPQIVKISSTQKQGNTSKTSQAVPCPYTLMRQYSKVRGDYSNAESEPFFVLSNGSPVTPEHVRSCLKTILTELKYDASLFSFHSYRIGRSNDLLKLGLSVETIKKIGRWKSNAVFRYLK